MMHGVAVILAGVAHSLAGVSFAALAIAVALHVGKLSAEARSWHWIVRLCPRLQRRSVSHDLGCLRELDRRERRSSGARR